MLGACHCPANLAVDSKNVGQASSLSGERMARAVNLAPVSPENPGRSMLALARSFDRLEACPTSLAVSVPGVVSKKMRPSALRERSLGFRPLQCPKSGWRWQVSAFAGAGELKRSSQSGSGDGAFGKG